MLGIFLVGFWVIISGVYDMPRSAREMAAEERNRNQVAGENKKGKKEKIHQKRGNTT